MTEELFQFCECGECGLRVERKGNRYINGHQNRGKHHTPAQLTADKAKRGAPRSAAQLAADEAKLGKSHTTPAQIAADKAKSEKQLGVPHTSEAQIAADKAKVGISRPWEVGVAISAAKLGVPRTSLAQIEVDKTRIERQLGGHDIVKHHYLYDHSDLSLNTVQMSRSDHGKLHRLLQILRYIIPHINMKEE